MAQNLFPVFDVPAAIAEETQNVNRFAPAPLWDFDTGDFVTNGARPVYGSGYDAWVQWCKKMIFTQRWAHYAYSSDAGIEAEEAFREPDREAAEQSLERTITEALMADPMGRTRSVGDFQFHWVGDELRVTCEVFGSDGNSAAIDSTLKH
jgi:hypothetical protein